MELLLLGFLLLALYVGADVLHRWMGVGAIAWGDRSRPQLALTFDDGPGPHTEAILERLRHHGVKATFFVLGSQVRAYPELLERIRAEGHQVESHGEVHRPAFWLLPWQEARQVRAVPGRYYRPPHGIHTPFTRFLARRAGKSVALWDVESRDWTSADPKALAERVLVWVRPGSVVLLHDNERFPQTLAVLDEILPRLKELGYQMVRLDELGARPLTWREGLMRASQGGHERYFRKNRVMRLGLGPFDYLAVSPCAFPGPSQPGLRRGEPSLEVHLDSVRTPAMTQMQLLREGRRGFTLLAEYLEQRPEIRGVWGISQAATALRVFGFHLAPVTPWQRLVYGTASTWFLWLYRGERPKRGVPIAQLAYSPREEFLARWKRPP
ncbi:MAG: polysaccharide deacetylase family protein [Meiothermus sp.]|uniref:polysaccharide deacetylase family protein n=1 Tax=Meiothermus sp. TaxID=1955249 RepID=UPI0025E74E13|nr:polysaccharide deacetylase family protein [Meiothermus sp.]MCS7195501.1 polysaccharide deacetylase family protein [Meiothermus sp.]